MANRARYVLTLTTLLSVFAVLHGLKEVTELHGVHKPQELFSSFRGLARGAQLRISWEGLSSGVQATRHAYLVLVTKDQYGVDGFKQETEPCEAPSVAREEIELIGDGSSGMEISTSKGQISGNITIGIEKTGAYTLYLVSCAGSGVKLHGRIETVFTNPSRTSRQGQQLSIEDTPLPTLHQIFVTVYAVLVSLWLSACYNNLKHVRPIHWCCLLALVLKLVDASANAAYYQRLNEAGEAPAALAQFASLSSSLGEALFLFVVLAISLGWLNHYSQARVRDVAIVGTIFGLLVSVILVRVNCSRKEELSSHGSSTCKSWGLVEYIVRSAILLSAILAQNYTINTEMHHVTEMIPPITPRMAIIYSEVNRLNTFRWGFLAYLMWPTILILLDAVVLESNYAYRWISTLLECLSVLLIYVPVGSKFSPSSSSLLTRPFRAHAPT